MHPRRTPPTVRARRSPRLMALALAASLAVTAGACGSDGEDDAGRTDTTANRGTVAGAGDSGAPAQGEPEGANTGSGGDSGGATGNAVDPGGDNP
jgi:hypothetical protein